jgi:Ser-tRNA(Ala) deacylase AlaX
VDVTGIRFWDDPYLTSLFSTVATAAADEVTLKQTIFYAFAGGQERDYGTIAGRDVLDARWEGVDIVYCLGAGHGLAAGDVVEIRIEGERRERLRRLHMATEIVLEVLTQHDPDLVKVGAHIAPNKARIDFESPVTLTDRLPRITGAVNAMIFADLPIVTAFSDPAGRRRYWEITGFARVPCAGTLPRSTREIGRVMLLRRNPGRGRERVEITLPPDA